MTAPLNKKLSSSFVYGRENIVFNGQGIDTIEQMAHHGTAMKLINKIGLERLINLKGTPVNDEVKRIKKEAKNKRLKPIIEVFKLSLVGRSLASYMIVSRCVPQSIKQDQEQKKSYGTHCVLSFAGLHQPTKKLHSQTMGTIKKFLERKRFYILRMDIATDTTDHREISHKRKESFKKRLAPYAKHGVIAPPNGATSLYINHIEGIERVSRILFYDKYLKQTKHQGQTLNSSLKAWKRIEVTLSFDLSRAKNRMSFKEYVNSNSFLNDVLEVNEIVRRINKKDAENSYLMYQISSFLDQRSTNNKESKKQFNSVESVERFKNAEYQRYLLPI